MYTGFLNDNLLMIDHGKINITIGTGYIMVIDKLLETSLELLFGFCTIITMEDNMNCPTAKI
jgi:hypothetical protein